ncbi:hypothetical protein BASA81_002669 [Batrachochytrium salamandrivorans]|nr:hypothetical protein BASA81_002669 [Batrachochytrium salamandrivorans]
MAKQRLVVVLGFYGSQAKHVDKYANVWRQTAQCDVITVPCSGSPWVLVTSGFFEAQRVLRLILSAQCDELVFHVLSNRGMLVYLNLVCVLLPKRIKVLGAVFDSCPGSLNPRLFFHATAANQTTEWKRQLFYYLPTALAAAALPVWGWKRWVIRLTIVELVSAMLSYVYHLVLGRLDPSRCPTLFLYSDADKLVSAEAIESVIEMRNRAMGQVTRKKFLGSPHVKHLLLHETEYVAAIQEFLRTIS